MPAKITAMNLGDIFDQLFKLLGKTLKRNLIIASFFMIPAALVLAYGFQSFFQVLSEISEGSLDKYADDFERFRVIMGGVGPFIVAMTFFLFAYVAAMLGITILASGEMEGTNLTWKEALNQTLSIRFGRLLGQHILVILVVMALMFFPIFLNYLSEGLALLIFVSIFLSIYLWIKWAFASVAIAWEATGIYEAFQRSWYLVQGAWWRTFGILILLTIVIQFGQSFITTPISTLFFKDFYAQYFNLIEPSSASQEENARILFRLFSTMGLGLGLLFGISAILSLLISPLIPVVMYFDLRARKGEFAEQEPPAEAPDEP